jgi:hypothetical protein
VVPDDWLKEVTRGDELSLDESTDWRLLRPQNSIAPNRPHRAPDDAAHYARSATAALIIVTLIIAAALIFSAVLVDATAVMRMPDVSSPAVPAVVAMDDMVTAAVVAFNRENRRSGKGNIDG